MMKNTLMAVLLLTLSFVASAQPMDMDIRILTPGAIKSLLGPYPAAGSVEELEDFTTLMRFQLTRTAADCEEARANEKTSISNLFAGPKGPLTKGEAKRATAQLVPNMGEAGVNILLAKQIYKRPRPYKRNPLIKPCVKLEGSHAYPSGHTTFSRLMALALSEIFPEKRDALLKRADEVAMSRVLGGVHHPTDIVAGKKLADAIFVEAMIAGSLEEALK